MIVSMATTHISEADAAGDFAGLMARVRAGEEIVIESGSHAVAVIRPASQQRGRLLSESIKLAENHAKEFGFEPAMDADFAADMEEIIASRKARDTSEWA